MPTANLNKVNAVYDDGLDSIVIVNCLGDIPGGRTLDMTGWTPETVKAGHVIIQNNTTKVCKPLGLNEAGNAYGSIPEGNTCIGVLKVSVLKSDARAAIMTIGQVKEAACPYPLTSTIKNKLSMIQFI